HGTRCEQTGRCAHYPCCSNERDRHMNASEQRGNRPSHDDGARPDRPARRKCSLVDVEQPDTADDDSELETYGVSISMSTWIAISQKLSAQRVSLSNYQDRSVEERICSSRPTAQCAIAEFRIAAAACIDPDEVCWCEFGKIVNSCRTDTLPVCDLP